MRNKLFITLALPFLVLCLTGCAKNDDILRQVDKIEEGVKRIQKESEETISQLCDIVRNLDPEKAKTVMECTIAPAGHGRD